MNKIKIKVMKLFGMKLKKNWKESFGDLYKDSNETSKNGIETNATNVIFRGGDEKQVINDVKMCKPADVDGNLSNAKIWIWFAQAVAVWLS